jgi:hypothetical protein
LEWFNDAELSAKLYTTSGDVSFFLQVETIRAILKKELDLPIVEIGDESAKLDGGDVLFTGTTLACSMQEAEVVTLFVNGL